MNSINPINHNAHQANFDLIRSAEDYPSALNWFYQKQTQEGFIDPDRLKINTLYTQHSHEYGIEFKILINRVRDAYAQQVVNASMQPTQKYCPLCVEYIDQMGQHLKQFVHVFLNDRNYVLSLTPFPSFEKHFVLSLNDHQPMFMNHHTIEDLLLFQKQLGSSYSIACNSDHTKTGASILDHHHVQILGVTHFPIADAKPLYQKTVTHPISDVLLEHLHFPATAIRLSSISVEALIYESKNFLNNWRTLDPQNTCNLWIRKLDNRYEIVFILRHPNGQTHPSLLRYKTEGIGIIEMCGFGIFPTPKIDTDIVLQEIKNNTADLMARLLQSHAPNQKISFPP
jgi:UDPglucose--hexose-1-phosphate uridylyltransferase